MVPMNTTSVQTPPLGRYEIDTSGSTLTFRSRHLFGLLPVRGTVPIRSGVVDVVEPLAQSTVRAEIDAAGFQSGHQRRDDDVRSARFLDTTRHPVLTFVADHVDTTAVSGTLTVRGTGRPVRLVIERAELSPGAFTVHASTRIDRTEFGVTAAPGMAGRHLDISLEVRCVHR
jgi:polyisoprenoid-binding protein YceI